MSLLWRVYVENVDPFIKILHVPTITEAIRVSEGHFDTLSPGMRALLFSISLAAVVSLGDTDVRPTPRQRMRSLLIIVQVQKTFVDGKEEVLSRFLLGAEQALSQAAALESAELSGIQAFLIYLESAGHRFGMRTVWMKSGMLVRTAMSIGAASRRSHFPGYVILRSGDATQTMVAHLLPRFPSQPVLRAGSDDIRRHI